MALDKLNELKVHLKDILDKGFIGPIIYPLGARVFLVKKKDESFKMCIDYHPTYKINIKNKYPLS